MRFNTKSSITEEKLSNLIFATADVAQAVKVMQQKLELILEAFTSENCFRDEKAENDLKRIEEIKKNLSELFGAQK